MSSDGFSKSLSWNDGMVEVFRNTEGDYRIHVCLDGSYVERIVGSGLPELVEVLHKLAPIAQTAMINDVYDQLASLLAELESDADGPEQEE